MCMILVQPEPIKRLKVTLKDFIANLDLTWFCEQELPSNITITFHVI